MKNKFLEDTSVPLSVLDLSPILQGKSPVDSFQNSLDLARHVDALGYKRFWLAEHHNMESIASSATSVLIGYIANGTTSIRVGSGGIMLPNHAPLIIAEQFGTLYSLFPDRIDLGLGRAPGTDQATAMALRRNRPGAGLNFEQDILELQNYFSPDNSNGKVRAIPGEGLAIPIWILGSSTDSAFLAARLGLPYAFASHFAPADLLQAIHLYKENFIPSSTLDKPYVMACVNVIAADSTENAKFISTSFLQLARGIITGERKPLPPPVKNIDDHFSDFERFAIQARMKYTFIGDQHSVGAQLSEFIKTTGVDELMAVSHIYEHELRKRSYSILKAAMENKKTA